MSVKPIPRLAIASLAMLPVAAATFALMIFFSANPMLALGVGMLGLLVVFLAGTVLATTSLMRKERYPLLGALGLAANLAPLLLMLVGLNR